MLCYSTPGIQPGHCFGDNSFTLAFFVLWVHDWTHYSKYKKTQPTEECNNEILSMYINMMHKIFKMCEPMGFFTHISDPFHEKSSHLLVSANSRKYNRDLIKNGF